MYRELQKPPSLMVVSRGNSGLEYTMRGNDLASGYLLRYRLKTIAFDTYYAMLVYLLYQKGLGCDSRFKVIQTGVSSACSPVKSGWSITTSSDTEVPLVRGGSIAECILLALDRGYYKFTLGYDGDPDEYRDSAKVAFELSTPDWKARVLNWAGKVITIDERIKPDSGILRGIFAE